MNRVVARFADGRVIKGYTNDFAPDKARFHVSLSDAAKDAKAMELQVADLKALYFVKDFAGDPKHDECKVFDSAKCVPGRRIRVIFKDGEEMIGTTQGYQPGRPGFFLMPADVKSNIERCYVVVGQSANVAFI